MFLLFLALDSWISLDPWLCSTVLNATDAGAAVPWFKAIANSVHRWRRYGRLRRPQSMDGTNDDDDMDDFSDSGLGRSSVSDIVHNRSISQLTMNFEDQIIVVKMALQFSKRVNEDNLTLKDRDRRTANLLLYNVFCWCYETNCLIIIYN